MSDSKALHAVFKQLVAHDDSLTLRDRHILKLYHAALLENGWDKLITENKADSQKDI